MSLVTRKSVFPYEYTDSGSRFDDTKLPSKRESYSSLTETGIMEEDFVHAKEVCICCHVFRYKFKNYCACVTGMESF